METSADSVEPSVASEYGDKTGTEPAESIAKEAAFGRLEAVKIREHWKDEARDFTPWLAREENLGLLGETVGLNLELVGTERRVGSFKADIVATDGENSVVIENQLDATDHRHLGQIMVYAAGQSARTVVWVAKHVTDEYRAVFDWLNEETSTDFWALEIELWRVGDSAPAPKFNVVSEPNELTKSAATEAADLSDTKLLQLEFWTGLADHLEEAGSSFNPRKAHAAHWYDLPIGTARANIALTAVVAGVKRIGCELWVSHSQANVIYEALEKDKDAIEGELGELEWQPLPDRKGCRIAVYRESSIEDRDSWPGLLEWLTKNAEAFKSVFAQRIKAVELGEAPLTGDKADAEPSPGHHGL